MTIFDNSGLTTEEFLQDYWQKKPLLLRRAFPDFRPELDANDIAGLACDELAESRLVTGRWPDGLWTVTYGPFDESTLSALPERDWSLLVQDVEKHYPPLRQLFAAFGFLPRWRFDDLMVSVAGPGGSVGPHVDQYDVFLLQASGRRRWQVAERFNSELEPGGELRILRQFEPKQDWLLEPGDLLYLPPGIAHFGVADGNPVTSGDLCMTWSIGMRAPSAADLLQRFGEWLAAGREEGGRYADPGIQPSPTPGEIDRQAISQLRDLARSAFDDANGWMAFVGGFLSSYRLAHEPAPPPRPVGPRALLRKLEAGARLLHSPWSRLLWVRTPEGALLFAGGDCFGCTTEAARAICAEEGLTGPVSGLPSELPDLLCELVNRGHLFIETV